ncbi:hypothetical protein SRB5_54110 [Streptomyces sp. RB5]|uniref:Integral membrane protein n=1 Tax=Streptomyces smaragdinus TaxID=2585196 RepID=A0A7K0CQE5_9ACTN|nr:DMT family transporter [Streptomyces smaragdinus]MQY15232.1 hypothetical protein [Streptomyces smaragdinus]
MSPFLLALLLSLISAAAYAGAAVLQERVASNTRAPAVAPLRSSGWWAAVGLNGSGAVLHVAALAYGSLSLVQPLGALTIVFALPIAAICVGRRAGRAAWTAALMCAAGLAVILSLTGSGPAHPMTGDSKVFVAAATLAGVGVLILVARRMGLSAARSLTLAVASGAVFGMASVFTKAVTEDASDPLSLAMIAVLAPAGVFLSQAAYRGAGLAAPLATLTVVNPVVAAAVGIVAMGESFRYGAAGALGAVLAALITAAGVFVLTAQTASPAPAPAATGAVPAQRQGARPCSGPGRVPGLPHARSRRDQRRPPRTAHGLLGTGRQRRRIAVRKRPAPEPAAAAGRGT